MSPRPQTRRRAAALLLAFPALALPACQDIGFAGADPDANSVLSIVAEPTPAEAAQWAVDPHDPDKRARGMLILANKPFGGEPVYLQMYRAGLTDSDPGVRAVAIRALALHGLPEDVPRIIEHFDSEDRLLRWECARALQRLHNPVAIGPLISHTLDEKEPEANIRAAACTALGQYAETRVVDALIQALDDRDLHVNLAAKKSLRTLTGRNFGYDTSEWVAWRRESDDLFADRGTYTYPVFYRTPSWVERVVPWMQPPNEETAKPVGMPVTRSEG